MNYLAIDTSGEYLTVIAKHGERTERVFRPDCLAKHSVVLMDEIDGVLSRAQMTAAECDFFAVVVGPGSFTGIRIGIATVKGLAFAAGKQVLPVTSLDGIAYSVEDAPVLALVDAGHGAVYACAYEKDKSVAVPPAYRTGEEASELANTFLPYAHKALSFGGKEAKIADVCLGLERAVEAKKDALADAAELAALYLRKSSAEEMRK